MPRPPSATTNDIIEKLNAGVPPSELAKQYSRGMVYRYWHKGKDGGHDSAVTSPPPPVPDEVCLCVVIERHVVIIVLAATRSSLPSPTLFEML